EHIRQREKRPGRPGFGIDRCTRDGGCTHAPLRGHHPGGGGHPIAEDGVGGERLLACNLDHRYPRRERFISPSRRVSTDERRVGCSSQGETPRKGSRPKRARPHHASAHCVSFIETPLPPIGP